MLITKILNSQGKPIELTDMEEYRARHWEREIKNSLGYEIPITTLTAIVKRVVEQKFFTVAPADYLPIKVGEGAFHSQLTTYRDYSVGDDFETGIINTGTSNSRLAEADSGVDSVTVAIRNWAKAIGWSIFDLKEAATSGNWDIVTSKERSRKRNWDLGVQRIAFLGARNDKSVLGLLTQPDVYSDLGTITQYINAMSATDFEAFLRGAMESYRSNANRTAEPTHFIIPEADYNGLAVATDETFPLISKLKRIEESFKLMTGNQNFKVMKLAYCDKMNNVDTINLNRYVFLNYDEDSIRMDIPVNYTATLAYTINGFNFQNVGYGQITGAKAYRPKEVLYFDWS